jgi:hypothetical protein
MKWQALFPGSYLSAVEIGDRLINGTISHVKRVDLDQEDGTKKARGVVFFEGTTRGWVMCKTTAQCVAAMFGEDVAGWTGKRLTLYATEVQVGKERKPAVRVKGSPDLTAPVNVVIKLPRKKPSTVKLIPTGNGAATHLEPDPVPPTEPDPEPIQDPTTGEVF